LNHVEVPFAVFRAVEAKAVAEGGDARDKLRRRLLQFRVDRTRRGDGEVGGYSRRNRFKKGEQCVVDNRRIDR